MVTIIFSGLLLLGAVWLFERVKSYLYWSALGVASLGLIFVIVVFVFPILHDFLLNI